MTTMLEFMRDSWTEATAELSNIYAVLDQHDKGICSMSNNDREAYEERIKALKEDREKTRESIRKIEKKEFLEAVEDYRSRRTP